MVGASTLDLGNLLIHLRGDSSSFLGMMNSSEKRLMSFGRKMQSTGLAMTLRVTAPIIGMGTAAVKSFASFDQAMNKSMSIMKELTPELREALKFEAVSLSKESITSAKDLAATYYSLASANLDAKQSLEALDVVNNFSIAGHMDMVTATRLSIDAQRTLGLAYQDAGKNAASLRRITDVLTFSNTLANATVEEYSFALGRYGAAAMKAYNIELEEGVAMLAAYVSQSIKGEHAGNMFSRMLRLTTAGFKDNRQAWDELGVDLYDADRNLKPLWTIINDISAGLAHLSPEAKIATLKILGFQARSQQAIFPLLGLGDAIEDNYKKLKNMSNFTEHVANDVMGSFSNQLKIAWNNVKEMARQIGGVLAPYVMAFAYRLKLLSEWFFELSDKQKKWIVMTGLIVAAIGPILFLIGKLLTSIALLSLAFRVLGNSAVLLAGKLMLAIVAPLAMAIVEMGLFLSAWFDMKKVITGEGGGGLGTWMWNEFDFIKKGGLWLASGLIQLFTHIKYAGKEAWLGIKLGFVVLKSTIMLGISVIGLGFAKMLSTVENALNKLPDLMKPDTGFNLGANKIEKMAAELGVQGIEAVEAVHKEMTEAWDEWMGAINIQDEALTAAFAEVEDAAADASKGIKNSMKDMVTDFVDAQLDKFAKAFGDVNIPALTDEQRNIQDKLDLLDTEIKYLGEIDRIKEKAIAQEKFAAQLRVVYAGNIAKQMELLEEYKNKVQEIEDAQRGPEEAGKKIKQWLDDATNVWSQMGDVAVHALDGISNSIAEMVNEGKMNFRSLAVTILKEIQMIIIKALIAQTVMAAIGMWTGGGGGMPNSNSHMGGSTKNFSPSAFHNGGVVGQGISAYHDGGMIGGLRSDERIIKAQTGELILSREDVKRAETQTPVNNVNIVNVLDKREILDAISGASGEKVIVNAIKRNKGVISGVLA